MWVSLTWLKWGACLCCVGGLSASAAEVLVRTRCLSTLRVRSCTRRPLSRVREGRFLSVVRDRGSAVSRLGKVISGFRHIVSHLGTAVGSLRTGSRSSHGLVSRLASVIRSLGARNRSSEGSGSTGSGLVTRRGRGVSGLAVTLASTSRRLSIVLRRGCRGGDGDGHRSEGGGPAGGDQRRRGRRSSKAGGGDKSRASTATGRRSVSGAGISSRGLSNGHNPHNGCAAVSTTEVIRREAALVPIVPYK